MNLQETKHCFYAGINKNLNKKISRNLLIPKYVDVQFNYKLKIYKHSSTAEVTM